MNGQTIVAATMLLEGIKEGKLTRSIHRELGFSVGLERFLSGQPALTTANTEALGKIYDTVLNHPSLEKYYSHDVEYARIEAKQFKTFNKAVATVLKKIIREELQRFSI